MILIFIVLTSIIQTINTQGVTGCPDHSIKLYETKLDGKIIDIQWVAPDYSTILIVTSNNTLWRSIDTGRNWELILPVTNVRDIVATNDGKSVIVIGYGKIMWNSLDGGKTFNSFDVPGYMDNVKFHPLHNTWILATRRSDTSNDLYLSQDLGKKWDSLRTHVWNYDWHGSADDDKLVILMEKTSKSGNMYSPPYTIQVVKSSTFFKEDTTVIAPNVAGYLALNEHIYIATYASSNSLQLKISKDRGENFFTVKFPLNLSEKRYTILDDSEGSTFINVQHEQNNWGNVYDSNALDNDFSISLEYNVRGYRGGCDFRRVKGLDGIYIANTFESIASTGYGSEAVTKITYDMGGIWQKLPVPKGVNCTDVNACQLNLLGASQQGTWYTKKEAIGLIIGTGNAGKYLFSDEEELGVFFSRDAGWNWDYITKGSHTYEISNRGAIILMAEDEAITNKVLYSLNEGLNWSTCSFSETEAPFDVDEIDADPELTTPIFLIYGTRNDNGVIVCADFTGVHERQCKGFDSPGTPDSDYEVWMPSDIKGDECLLGRRTRYIRRKREAECIIPPNVNSDVAIFVKNCSCTEEDYECDYCFERVGLVCEPSKDIECLDYDPKKPPADCQGYWEETLGYRRVPGDTCDAISGINHLPIRRPCPGITPTTPTSTPIPSSTPSSVPIPSSTPTNVTQETYSSLTFIIVILCISLGLGSVTVLLWWSTGRNQTTRDCFLRFLPERMLPDFRVPGAQYATLENQPFEEDDLEEDAPVLDLDEHETPKDEFNPRV